jgi:DnaK suppressor protein
LESEAGALRAEFIEVGFNTESGNSLEEGPVDMAITKHILPYPGCETMRVLEERGKQMDDKKTQKFRQRLLEEYQKLIRSINRNRLAEEEIKLENTEDEGDLATISHNKELLYNLHESDFQRLKSIQEALKRMDRGEYGECVRCGEDINEKRLMAVPWATLCIQCQEEAEKEGSTQRPVMAGMLKSEEEDEE